MADKKISQLTSASTPLAGTETLPIVQSGVTSKATVDSLTAGRTVNASAFATGTAAAGCSLGGTALTAVGTDANIGMTATPKGTGSFNVSKTDVFTYSGVFATDCSVDRVNSASANNQTAMLRLRASSNGGTVSGIAAIAVVQPNFANNSGDIVFLNNNFGSTNERMRITSAGNIVAGASAALATAATDGFLYVPTCAGVPTGTPTAITGMVPIVVDTTNNRWYFYSGGSWRNAGP